MTDFELHDAAASRRRRLLPVFAILAVTAVLVPVSYLAASRFDGVSTRSSKTASVGTPAPAIALPMADGSTWDLAKARADGPVVLVFLRGFF